MIRLINCVVCILLLPKHVTSPKTPTKVSKDVLSTYENLLFPSIKSVTPHLNCCDNQTNCSLINEQLTNQSRQRLSLSDECQKSLIQLQIGLKHHQKWAFHMIDATSKSIPGTFYRTLINIGYEKECLNIVHIDASGHIIRGSYSLIHILSKHQKLASEMEVKNLSVFPKFMYSSYNHLSADAKQVRESYGLIYSICHPHMCSASDISYLIDEYFNHKIDFKVVNANRSIKTSIFNISYLQLISISLIATLIIYSILSTIKCHINKNIYVGNDHFDIICNAKEFYNKYKIDDKHSNKDTNFINGYKSIYLISALFGHTTVLISPASHRLYTSLPYYVSFGYEDNYKMFMRSNIEMFLSNVVASGIVSIVSIVPFIEHLKRFKFRHLKNAQNSKFGAENVKTKIGSKDVPKDTSILIIIATVRYLRMIPMTLFIVMIMIISPLILNFTNVPGIHNKYILNDVSNRCSTYGWRDLLLISNWFTVFNVCYTITWFMSADFQLAIITFPLVMSLVKDIKGGARFAMFYVASGICLEYVLNYHENQFIVPNVRNETYYDYHFMHNAWTSNYISTYSMSLVYGMLIYRKIRIDDKFAYLIKYVASVCISIIMLSIHLTQDMNEWTPNMFKYMIGSMIKTISGLCLCTLTYLLWHVSYDNIIKRLLTWTPMFNTISRIMMPSFLIHGLLIEWTTAMIYSNTLEFTIFKMVQRGSIVVILTVICGTILHILVEVPFMKMLKSFIK